MSAKSSDDGNGTKKTQSIEKKSSNIGARGSRPIREKVACIAGAPRLNARHRLLIR